MTDDLKQPLPVAGYTAQPDAKIALVNEFKQDEERLLRKIDAMWEECFQDSRAWLVAQPKGGPVDYRNPPPPYDEYWLVEARQSLQVAFMALNRAVFQPQRIKLPEDEP